MNDATRDNLGFKNLIECGFSVGILQKDYIKTQGAVPCGPRK